MRYLDGLSQGGFYREHVGVDNVNFTIGNGTRGHYGECFLTSYESIRDGDPIDEEMDLQEQINVESSHLFDDPIQQPFIGIVCRCRVTGGVYVPQLSRQLRVFSIATVP